MNTIDKVTNYGTNKLAFEHLLEIWKTLPAELTRVFTRLNVLRISGIVDIRTINRLAGSIAGLKELIVEINLYAVTKSQGTSHDFFEWGNFTLTKDQLEFITTKLFSRTNISEENVVSYSLNPDFDKIMSQIRKSDHAVVAMPDPLEVPPSKFTRLLPSVES